MEGDIGNSKQIEKQATGQDRFNRAQKGFEMIARRFRVMAVRAGSIRLPLAVTGASSRQWAGVAAPDWAHLTGNEYRLRRGVIPRETRHSARQVLQAG